MTNAADIIAIALEDAANIPAGSTICVDPNVGGLSWVSADRSESGGIGVDAELYGDGELEDTIDALRNAGYDV